MLLVDKILSTGIWSTDYCRKIFVDTTLRRHSTSSTSILSKFFRRHDISSTNISSTQHFVDKTFRRHDTSSKFFCRHKHAEVEELLRVLNFVKGPRRICRTIYLEKLNTGFCRAQKVISSGM
jgi:hypothetical protein